MKPHLDLSNLHHKTTAAIYKYAERQMLCKTIPGPLSHTHFH